MKHLIRYILGALAAIILLLGTAYFLRWPKEYCHSAMTSTGEVAHFCYGPGNDNVVY